MSSLRNEPWLLAYEELGKERFMDSANKAWEQYRHRAEVNSSTRPELALVGDLRAAVEATVAEAHLEAVRGCCENEELQTLHSLIDQALLQTGTTHADVGLPKSYPNSMDWIVKTMQLTRQKCAQAIIRAEQAEERLKQITDLLGMPPGCSGNRGGT